MKKVMKRVVVLALAASMLLSMTACGNGKKTNGKNSKVEAVTFPLEEKVTFTFMVPGTEDYDFAEKMSKYKMWQELEEATNVHIEFDFLGENAAEQLALRIQGNTYGDVVWGGNILTSISTTKYVAADVLIDISDYLVEEIMPNYCADVAERPTITKMITAADGGIYTLPRITGQLGYYLENPIWINKAWLDKLGLSVPKTLDEFTNVLRAFKEKDPNGNGMKDEIPYICATTHGYMHTEALLGMWGIATKDSTYDSFVQVKDGKVTFAPAQDAYKEAITYLSQLYKEGLMWDQCFTASSSALNAKVISTTPVVGVFTSKEPAATAYADDYICIAPPKVEGYEPCWYYHGGMDGSKNQFGVTDKCENVNVLMAWMDYFYDLDWAMRAEYGEPGEGRIVKKDDGTYEILTLDYDTQAELDRVNPTLTSKFGTPIRSITESDYANKITQSKSEQIMQNNYEIYKDIINKETWPRPYYAAEDVYDADTYTADINYLVQTKRGEWITGRSDVNKDWNSYISKLDELGLQEMLKIMQKAYDAVKAE